jgi:hypothetical protein
VLKKYGPSLKVGSLDTKKEAAPAASDPAAPIETAAKAPAKAPPAGVSETVIAKSLDPFGDLIPFADPAWYHGVCGFDILLGTAQRWTVLIL